MSSDSALRTPLHKLHLEYDAKMVEFAGWEMPIRYSDGIMSEHKQCRNSAALFDVSHMGQIELRGENVAQKLESLVPADIISLKEGKARYTQFTNEQGGIMDDLIVTNAGDHFFVVVNASMRAQDIKHMQDNLKNVDVIELANRALIAVQGPCAEDVVSGLFPAAQNLVFMESTTAEYEGDVCRVSRMGYTGEDGFEISVPAIKAEAITRTFLQHSKCALAGLGARDTLRLEAGLCLYGNDIDNNTSPIEASLLWSIPKRRREEGGFIGSERILNEIKTGVKRKLVGIKPSGRAPAREGVIIQSTQNEDIGFITSGGFGPTIEGPVAMGYIDSQHSDVGTSVNLIIRGKSAAAQIVALPFVKPGYKR